LGHTSDSRGLGITSGEEVVRTLSYSLPTYLHDHIDVIVPSTYFATIPTMRVANSMHSVFQNLVRDTPSVPEGAVAPSCNTTITPACLRALYNTTNYVPVSTNVNQIAVVGFDDKFANYADLQVGTLLQELFSISNSTYE
jgi:tripeptidyl-peptidase I